jgi:hypothetical protein
MSDGQKVEVTSALFEDENVGKTPHDCSFHLWSFRPAAERSGALLDS